LPYTDDTDGVTTFTAEIPVRLAPLSSTVIRFAPDDCIEEYSVNGGTPHDLRQTDRGSRCWPFSYPIDLAAEGQAGTYLVRLTLKNDWGAHKIDAHGSLTTLTALAACLAAWLAFMFLLWPWLIRLNNRGTLVALHSRRLAMCSVGVLFTAGLLLNIDGSVSISHGRFVALVACAAAVGLLFAALDHSSNRPLFRRPSAMWAAVSFAAFVAAALEAHQTFEPISRFLLVLLGVCASAFAVTPFFATLRQIRHAPRAAAVAMLAAALPLAFDECRLPAWQWLVGPTTQAVAAMMNVAGQNATVAFGTRIRDGGAVVDYYGYVTTPNFSVQIGSWCGGFEGMTLFLFLLAGFVLLDWREFSSARRLWVPFLAAIPYLFTVNVLRISGILVYALLIAGEVDQAGARHAAVEMFHSNAGWVIYSLAFGPYLSVVYWWARRKAKMPTMQSE
jgi:exosortase/archaeosortase family protein